MTFFEKFRDTHSEGYEVWAWTSGYEVPRWDLGVWVSFDKWGLGIETEVDPGGCWDDAERRRFTALQIGPVAIVLTRSTRSKYAP